MIGRAVRSLAWVLGLLVALGIVVELGHGALSAPPVHDADALGDWLAARDTATAAVALVRVLAVGVIGYLLAIVALAALAHATQVPVVHRFAELATIPALRRVLGTVGGLGLAATAGTLLASDALPGSPPGQGPSAAAEAVVLERMPDADGPTLERLPDDVGPDIDPGPSAAPSPRREWLVTPGDHLWHIAAATLAEAWGRAPTDAEVAPFWVEVVDVNRPRLIDPEDPDLIVPGQVLLVPDPLARARGGPPVSAGQMP